MPCRSPSSLKINSYLKASECFFVSHLQSYDSGFGQGSGRESHGEYHIIIIFFYTCLQEPVLMFFFRFGCG